MRDVFCLHPEHKERQSGVAGKGKSFVVRQTDRQTGGSPALVRPPPSSVTLGKFRV